MKFPTLQIGIIARDEKDMLASIEKIAWEGNDICSYGRQMVESGMRCWGLGDTYSRIILADVLQARKVNYFSLTSIPSFAPVGGSQN